MNVAEVVLFTVRCALEATAVLLAPGTVLAWVLARGQWRGKSVVETLVDLPLVMPPVATGLLLLKFFGRHGPAGSILHGVGIDVVFTWRAVVIAMAVMAFPLFVRSARIAFEHVSRRYEEIARTLGASEARVFFTITLRLASRGIVGGALLAFARALGEFGATVLVAGNIPGRTSTLSTSIYNLVQLGNDDRAMVLLAISVAIAFAAVLTSELLFRKARP
jgi:molybdate transport system permease protein